MTEVRTDSNDSETPKDGSDVSVNAAFLATAKSDASESRLQSPSHLMSASGGVGNDGDEGKRQGSLASQGWRWGFEILFLLALFFVYAGDSAPMVNEAHYLVKAKHFWNPEWCKQDMFVASAKAHTTFYVLFGWPTKYATLAQTAWLGRLVGWLLLAFGLQRLSWVVFRRSFFSLVIAVLWIAGIEYGNLAGEWRVGGIEAKVPTA